jgi:hypothetical protein
MPYFMSRRRAPRWTRTAGWSALVLTLLVGAHVTRARGAAPDGTAVTTLFYTGEQRGYLEPCGCAKPQIGGLARRGAYLKRLPSDLARLQIDNGDLVDTIGRQSELKSEAMAEFFKEAGYAAVNLGEKDFALGFGYLRYLQSICKVPFLSGNVVRPGGAAFFESHVMRTIQVGGEPVSVAIVGLISPRFQTEIAQWNPGFQVAPPGEVLATLKPAIVPAARRVILLYHGGPEEARGLAEAHPWIDAIVTAHEAEDFRARAERAGNAIMVNAGQKGKHLGRLELKRADDGTPRLEHRLPVEMSHEIADDPNVRAILNRYLAHVGEEDLLSKLPKRKTPNGQSFAGTQACVGCHTSAHQVWEKSAHAKAWKTLIEAKHDRDPDCVGCHVVGLEHETGFKSIAQTPKLVDVGCESCHGAQGSHAREPARFRPPKVGAASCAQCHVPEHSPSFDYETFWKKIAH